MTVMTATPKRFSGLALLRRYCQGDYGAFDSLYLHYSRPLFSLFLSVTGRRQDAEDLLQELFLRLSQRPQAFAFAEDFESYLFRSARNLVTDHLRSKRARLRPTQLESDETADYVTPREPAFENRNEEINRALAKLPEEQRTVVVLKHFHDMTFDAIAAMLAIPSKTAQSRYYYGITKLKEMIREE